MRIGDLRYLFLSEKIRQSYSQVAILMTNIFFSANVKENNKIFSLHFSTLCLSKKGQEDGGEGRKGPIEPPWVQNELEQKELYCVTVCSELAFTAICRESCGAQTVKPTYAGTLVSWGVCPALTLQGLPLDHLFVVVVGPVKKYDVCSFI